MEANFETHKIVLDKLLTIFGKSTYFLVNIFENKEHWHGLIITVDPSVHPFARKNPEGTLVFHHKIYENTIKNFVFAIIATTIMNTPWLIDILVL